VRARLAAVPRPVLVAVGVALAAALAVAVALLLTAGRDTATGPGPTGTVAGATAEATAAPTPTPAPSEAAADAGEEAPPAPDAPVVVDADLAAPYEPTTTDPVALDATATFSDGVTARLVSLEAVQGEAQGPGEVAGPAVRVTVELTNGTAGAVGLGAAVVNAYAGADALPSEPLSGPRAQPFGGVLAPGASVSASYVFRVPEGLRDRLQVTVSHDPRVADVLFEGAAPSA